MKVTSFYPEFTVRSLENDVYFYEDMGFYPVHEAQYIGNFKMLIMENKAGQRIDLCEVPDFPPKFFATRINVDSLDDAIKDFEERGWKVCSQKWELPAAKSVLMESESGDTYNIIQHIK